MAKSKLEELKAQVLSDKKRRAENIIGEMQVKLHEIESLRKQLKKESYAAISPARSKAMLEEITVPSLEIIRDERKRH